MVFTHESALRLVQLSRTYAFSYTAALAVSCPSVPSSGLSIPAATAVPPERGFQTLSHCGHPRTPSGLSLILMVSACGSAGAGEEVLSWAELLLEEPVIALTFGRHFTLLTFNKFASC